MEKDIISLKIQEYKNGNQSAVEELFVLMQPLIKKYAGKTHFMEYDDAFQEYSISFFEAVYKIKLYENDGQALAYINACVKNKFCALYKKHISTMQYEEVPYEPMELYDSISDSNAELLFFIDVKSFINQINSATKKKIAILICFENREDTEIARLLKVSRQYVNRVRRWIYKEMMEKLII